MSRLNGVVSGIPASGSSVPPWQRKSAIPPGTGAQRQATPAERKQQLSQLAAMGVAVPEDFRREMAMAGDWQTLSERPVYDDEVKKEEDLKDTKPSDTDSKEQALNIGVRKRKYEGQDEEEEAGERVVRRGWGSTTRTYHGSSEDIDLDELLNGNAKRHNGTLEGGIRGPEVSEQRVRLGSPSNEGTARSMASIKKEESDSNLTSRFEIPEEHLSERPMQPGHDPVMEVVFKKRKPKQVRQN